jgi:hypothetical protein
MQPPNAGAGPAGREHPPFTDAWEKVYVENHEKVKAGPLTDPLTFCGIPAGFPRVMNVPDLYEFVIRPEQVWLLTENGPNVTRIYTDGTPLPGPNDRWPTYTGWSSGHWEGDTLVFETVGIKGWSDKDVIIDRTGLVISDQAHFLTRLRKTDENTLEMNMVVTDPVALKAPWNVTKTYTRQPKGTRIYDYACNENNRNPVDEEGKTLVKGPDGGLLE